MKDAKMVLYVFLFAVAGTMFGFIAAGVIEYVSTQVYGILTLEAMLYGILSVLGLLAGVVCGPIAWKKIYVEGLRGNKYISK